MRLSRTWLRLFLVLGVLSVSAPVFASPPETESSNPFTAAFMAAIRYGTAPGTHVRKALQYLDAMEQAIVELKPADPQLAHRLLVNLNKLDAHLQAHHGPLGFFLWKMANDRIQAGRRYIAKEQKDIATFYARLRAKDKPAAIEAHIRAQKNLDHLSAGIRNGQNFLRSLSAVLP